jgi:hypothetical protein
MWVMIRGKPRFLTRGLPSFPERPANYELATALSSAPSNSNSSSVSKARLMWGIVIELTAGHFAIDSGNKDEFRW